MSNLVNVSSLNPTPYTGVFGSGRFLFYTQNATFTVPTGITSVRVRLWGAGGSGSSNGYGGANGAGGGGFSLRVITGLTSGQSIAVTVGTGTSSFGAFLSATQGNTSGSGGNGSGGDINFQGGASVSTSGTAYSGGGGSASLFGRGGNGVQGENPGAAGLGGAGGGGSMSSNIFRFYSGGPGLTAASNGYMEKGSTSGVSASAPVLFAGFSIDFLGTGSGGCALTPGFNGGGAGCGTSSTGVSGSFPGGGGSGPSGNGGNGLVIVEY